jgi:glycosyltransferase involved in cell wall biosynthesis
MGANTRFHAAIYKTIRRYPGITVLHDLNLNSFFGDLYLLSGQLTEYTRLMASTYGREGLAHVRAAHRGEVPYDIVRYPLFEPVVQRSLGTIVHSQFAESLLHRRCPGTPVAQMQLLTNTDIRFQDTNLAKLQLGYNPSDIIIAAYGYMAPQKRLDRLLTISAKLRTDFPQFKLVIVGKAIDDYDLSTLIEDLELSDITKVTGYVDESLLHTYLAATDIGFNLRYPTIGESSATLMALMAAGKASLVSNVDAFREFPDSVCMKVDIGDDEDRQIEAALRYLLTDMDLRHQMGSNARKYVEHHCNPRIIAQQYLQFIEEVLKIQSKPRVHSM